ncbi:DUF5979 domain-containing protein [Agromyces atrinae]|uniref:Uncharacterized protein n=1 Tax=Agromyces atrinae TaxID=592376 RepID=A0A4Q2MEZ1_9MICO|nr:DUF5979 domain-containing protein [Agromyces atrinae]NYD68158.1 hypothetical protein [Agromyces atrinae]RXZ87700.1 hypothetical protein ESP50_00380 [Agromyces atrinae]
MSSALALGSLFALAPAQAAESGTVAGTVFLDYNSDGVFQPTGTPAERGFAGVTATAFDAAGTAVGSTTSAADGSYSISVVDAVSAALRVEFELSAEQVAEGYRDSFAVLDAGASESGSSVQFVTVGQTGVSFGVNNPEDFNTGSADLLVPVHNPGNPLQQSGKDTRGLVSVEYSATGNSKGDQTKISAATPGNGSFGAAQGVVWGNAFDSSTGDAYTAAFLRRFGGFGDGNLGGLYQTDVAGKTTSVWIDLEAAGIDVGGSVLDGALGIGTPASASARNSARGLVASTVQAVHDSAVFPLVGKVGLGAAVVDEPGRTLYVANLYERNVVSVPINADGSAGTPTSIDVPGLDADERIFGLHLYRNQLYVGVTETAGNAANTGSRSDLGARVISAPTSDLSSWTQRIDVTDLTFQRGMPDWSFEAGGTNAGQALWNATKRNNASHWNAWTDSWASGDNSNLAGPGKTCLRSSNQNEQNRWYCAYPQPILSSIDFDADGNMLLGFADRFSFQHADFQWSPTSNDTNLYWTFAMGDTYVAGKQSAGAGATYLLEQTGSYDSIAGDRTASWVDNNPGISVPGLAATNNQQGPGGGEFFYDRNRPSMSANWEATHFESSLGALATLEGVQQFPTTGFSTQGSRAADFFGSGLKWLNQVSGATDRAYDITTRADACGATLCWPNVPGAGGSATDFTSFGKAGGLGDLQFLVDAAPVQIGNYVWFDADQDGVQGADEPALAGVTVELYSADGSTLLGTTTTDANGEYYFSSLTTPGFEPKADYQVKFVAPTSGTALTDPRFGTVDWSQLSLTQAEQGGNTLIDSNPDPQTGVADVSVGAPGQNDHSIDAGFVGVTAVELEKQIDTEGGPSPPGFEFSFTTEAIDFRGNPITLAPSDAAFTLQADGVTKTITLPIGAKVRFTEAPFPTADGSVVWSPTPDADGWITASGTVDAPTRIIATNRLLLPGSFELTKSVTGDGAAAVPDDFEFTVDYSYTDPFTGALVSKSLTVTKGSPVDVSDDIPAGVTVTLVEGARTGAPPSVGWGTPVFSGPGVTDNGDGSATFVVASDTQVEIGLENPADELVDGFQLTKSVTGGAAGSVGTDFDFVVNATYVPADASAPAQLTVQKNGSVSVTDLALGTVVTLSEVQPVDGQPSPEVSWGTPVWSGTGVTVNPDGSASFTITDGASVQVALENPTAQLVGDFSIEKVVTGDAPVDPDLEFSFEYSTDAGATWIPVDGVTAGAAGAWSSPELPTGTTVQVREIAPTGSFWGAPEFTVDGVASAEPVTFTIGDGTSVAVVVTNPTLVGDFSIEKVVSGSAEVDPDLEFSFEYSTDAGATWVPVDGVTAGAAGAWTSPELPTGTEVLVREIAPSGDFWSDPTFTVDGVPVASPAALTIGDDSTVAVVVTNPTTVGDFTIEKIVTGSAEVDPDFEFSFEYSVDAGATWVAVDGVLAGAANAWTSPEFNTGTPVLVREIQPVGAFWGEPSITVDGVTQSGDASFVIGESSTVAVVVTNPTGTGDFTIEKVISGSAVVDPDFGFSFEYSVDGGAWVAVDDVLAGAANAWTSPEFNQGSVIAVREVAPTGAFWGTPVITIDGVTQPSQPATFVVGGGTTVAVVVTNPTEVGTFTIEKVVTGDAVVDPGQTFDFEYSTDGGTTWIAVSDVAAGPVNAWTSPEFTVGTEIQVREVTPSGPIWGTPTITVDGVDAGDPAVVTIQNDPDVEGGSNVAVVVTNPTLVGDFSIEKIVSGSAVVDPDFEFSFEYSTDDGATWVPVDGVLAGAANAWTSPSFNAGTTVQVREIAPAGAFWGDPTFTVDGVATTAPVELTIGADSTVAVVVTNPTSTGDFSIEKVVSGSAEVDPDLEFSFEYSVDGGATWVAVDGVTAGADNAWTSPAFNTGTEVQVREIAPTGAFWGTPTITVDGVAAGDPAVLTIGDGSTVAVVVTNPTLVGDFLIEKIVSGDVVVDPDFGFSFEYSTDGGTSWVPVDGVLAGSANTWTSPEFNTGTEVQVREIAPTGAFWGDPTFTVDGVAADQPVEFTIGDGSTVAVVATNPTNTGDFSIEKIVSGDAVVDPDFEFSFEYAVDGGAWVRVDGVTAGAANSWTSPLLPTGSTVQVRELAPVGPIWASPTFTVDGVPAEQPVEFTIGDGSTVAVVATNPTLVGGFTIEKRATAEAGTAWTATVAYGYEVDGAPVEGSLELTAAAPIAGLSGINAGTAVTLSEVAFTGLPAGVEWSDFTWAGDVVDNGDGTVTITVGDEAPVALVLTNDVVTPSVEIVKGDAGFEGSGDEIVNDADTMADGEFYQPGETRTIVFTPTNKGTEALVDVVVTDQTIAGADVQALQCVFPNGDRTDGVFADGGWTVAWAASSADSNPATWLPGVSFTCTATLTVEAAGGVHVDNATVSGTGVASGVTVTDENPYNAFTADIQVIKYDGNLADPAVKDADGNWITPGKPLADLGQDANDTEHSVKYVADRANAVRWVVTNTGPTFLTSVDLTDVTATGPAIESDWTCDLLPVGGPSGAYSFVKDGAWNGLFAPGQSFFCEGTLTLGANAIHQDTVTVVSEVVVPEVDENGVPTGNPSLNPDGTPVIAVDGDGNPRVLTDDDPFNAYTPAPATAVTGFGGSILGILALLLMAAGILAVIGSRRRVVRR